jgi:phosphoesterase RecJ-like protein
MRLLGHCLSQKMEIFPAYHSALIWLSKEELEEYDFHQGDTEGFVNYPLSIKGIVFTAFFMEMSDNIKISFRSKGDFATNEFSATHFFGGGHRNAAGGEIKLPMCEALKLFRQVLPLYKDQLNKESKKLS